MTGFVLLALLAGVVALFLASGAREGPAPAAPAPTPAAAPAVSSEPLPSVSPGGWKRGEIERYSPDTLFEKIDGKAEAYLAYDVAGLRSASYSAPDSDDLWVDVYLYDMGEPLRALGIYRAERTGTEPPAAIGDEACAPGGAVFVRRGRFYLQVLPSTDGAAAEAAAIAKAAADALPAGGEPATDPPWFPAEGRTIVRFDLRDSLMIPSLDRTWLALYADGAKLLVSEPEDPVAAAAEAEENLDFLGTPGVFRVVGKRLAGVVGAPPEADAGAMLDDLAKRIGEGR